MLVEGSLLYNLEPVILLPLYLFFIRPFISYYIPGTQARMGMGMLATILTLVISLRMEIIAYQEEGSLSCMLSTNIYSEYFEINSTHVRNTSSVVASFYYIVIIQQTISRLFDLITLIAMYEFIVAPTCHDVSNHWLVIHCSWNISSIWISGISSICTMLP